MNNHLDQIEDVLEALRETDAPTDQLEKLEDALYALQALPTQNELLEQLGKTFKPHRQTLERHVKEERQRLAVRQKLARPILWDALEGAGELVEHEILNDDLYELLPEQTREDVQLGLTWLIANSDEGGRLAEFDGIAGKLGDLESFIESEMESAHAAHAANPTLEALQRIDKLTALWRDIQNLSEG